MTKNCPKCSEKKDIRTVVLGPGGFSNYEPMDEKPVHPHYHMLDYNGAPIPWGYANTPKMYVCPKCGLMEWYMPIEEKLDPMKPDMSLVKVMHDKRRKPDE